MGGNAHILTRVFGSYHDNGILVMPLSPMWRLANQIPLP